MRRKRRRTKNWSNMAALVIGAAFAGTIVLTVVSSSDTASCTPRQRVVSGLSAIFGEEHRAVAPTAGNAMMEFFASEREGTWTLLRTLPDGRSCVVATGQAPWRATTVPLQETAVEI